MDRTEVGGVPGYLAKPAGSGPWPTLLVVHEWWGLDQQTRTIADRFAWEGYLAFAPDLYHGDLATLGDNASAMGFMKAHMGTTASDMIKASDALQQHPESSGKRGSVGFCFGGRMSLGLGIDRPLDAVCTFYGGQMQTLFERMGSFHSPVLGFFGDADVSIPAGTIDEFRKVLVRQGVEHAITVYPDSGHAFFRDSDPTVYKAGPSKDAWNQVLVFLGKTLKQQTRNKIGD